MSRSIPRLIRQADLVLEREWHPLDGVPAPNYVPEVWTPEHVGHRMIEAFDILGRLPDRRGGGATWPAYVHDFDDHQDFEDRRGDFWEQERRERVTSVEIAAMEQSIAWPMHYLADQTDLARVVMLWAYWRARGFDIEPLVDKYRVRYGWRSYSTFRRRRSGGLLVIAVGLIADEVQPA